MAAGDFVGAGAPFPRIVAEIWWVLRKGYGGRWRIGCSRVLMTSLASGVPTSLTSLMMVLSTR